MALLRQLALASLFVLAACPSGQHPCKLHSDCPQTERCVGGFCSVVCRIDRDCEGLGQCLDGQCVLVVPGGGPGGGGQAGGNASGGGSAGGGSTGGGQTGGGATGGGATGGGAVGGGATGGGATGGGSTGGGTGTGMVGDACEKGSDCQSTLCVGATGAGVCTRSCANESVCPQGWACLDAGGTNVCVPSDSGHPCPTGTGATCFAGICLQHPSNVSLSVCATPCETTRACPAGFSCSLTQVGANQKTVCTPVGQACSGHGTSTACHGRYCAAQAQSPSDGVCTNTCRDALDCPNGWACGLDDAPAGGGLISVCQPVGAVCTVNGQDLNNCYSQTCATDANPSSGTCTALCMNASTLAQESARCPAGWTCAAVPVGQATWYACQSP